jgi:hypothetical protein
MSLPKSALVRKLRGFKKKQKYRPKTKEEILAAVEMVERVVGRSGAVWCFSPHLNDALAILCEQTRNHLATMETPAGCKWVLASVEEEIVERLCSTCDDRDTPANHWPCNSCWNRRLWAPQEHRK